MHIECPVCGVPGWSGERCVKCDELLIVNECYSVDMVHHGETFNEASRKLEHAVESAWQNGYKGIMIIHGYGSRIGHSSVIHDLIRPCLHRAGRKLRARVVPAKYNRGAHILYFNPADRRVS